MKRTKPKKSGSSKKKIVKNKPQPKKTVAKKTVAKKTVAKKTPTKNKPTKKKPKVAKSLAPPLLASEAGRQAARIPLKNLVLSAHAHGRNHSPVPRTGPARHSRQGVHRDAQPLTFVQRQPEPPPEPNDNPGS